MEYDKRELYAVYVAGEDGAPKPAMVQRMCTGGFSWLALLITPMYLLYRKQYVAAGCWFALSFSSDLLLRGSAQQFMGMVFLAASIGFGLKFYALARWRAELLMRRAIDEQGATTPREAFAYVRTRGGTNGAAVFAACFIGAVAVVVLALLGA